MINVICTTTDFLLLVDSYKKNSYYTKPVAGSPKGIIELYFSPLSELKETAWYIHDSFCCSVKAVGLEDEFDEDTTYALWSNCVDDGGVAFILNGDTNDALIKLNEYLCKFDTLDEACVLPHSFKF